MSYTQAQHAVISSFELLLKSDLDMYQNRNNFRLQSDEIVHIKHRISLEYKDMVNVEDEDIDGNRITYQENRCEEFYYHIWFNRNGWVWFLVSDDNPFPIFGKDIMYKGSPEEYNDFAGRGSRYYFFGDVIETVVLRELKNRIEDLERHYVWNVSNFSIFKYEEE